MPGVAKVITITFRHPDGSEHAYGYDAAATDQLISGLTTARQLLQSN